MREVRLATFYVLAFMAVFAVIFPNSTSAQAQQGGSIGIEGRINGDPPTQGAVISFPTDGSVINDTTVTVTGICPSGLIVKIFRNGIFAGATPCINGNFSVQIDLFAGRNEIIARVYDDLDQAGPDSNIVVVNVPSNAIQNQNRITLTSPYAKKGTNPGQSLTWPITLSGGNGPYAITVDWGDGKTSDILSRQFPGTFDIEHVYDSPGVYIITIRATDRDGNVAFLQLIGVANGPLTPGSGNNDGSEKDDGTALVKTRILWAPMLFAVPLIASAFWLGRRHELHVLRKRLERREKIS